MRRIFIIIAIILIIGWAILFFGQILENGWEHLILLIAVLFLVWGFNGTGRGGSRRMPNS